MNSFARFFGLLPQFFPPHLSLDYLKNLGQPLVETLTMAAGGIAFALIFGFLFGVWAGAQLPGGKLIYGALAGLRSIPDLTLAILCVIVVGIGPAAGMMALAIFYCAALGKIFADLFLSADPGPVTALRATGATRLAVAFVGLIPLRLRDILSYGCFEFESAVRASVIVGAVGGGGLGTEMVGTINALDYRSTTTLILVLVALVAAIDLLARLVKLRPRLVALLFPLTVIAFWFNRPHLQSVSHAASTIRAMFPPVLPEGSLAGLPQLFLETLEIAVVGTLLAIPVAMALGLLAARNLTPAFLSIPSRRFLELLRSVPEIVWGLTLVSAIGIGPRAGIVALALHTSGSLGRLYAESFENIELAPVAAMAATGAPPLAIAGFGFVPLALPPLAIHAIFRFEWNIRAATVLGIIGAGGLGQALYNAQQLFHYREMMAYLVIIAAMVGTVDFLSGRLRRRLKLSEINLD